MVLFIAEAQAIPSSKWLQVNAYGNVDAQLNPTERPEFQLGAFDLFLSSRPHRQLTLLTELVVEVGFDGRFGIDPEQLAASWEFHRLLRVSAGRLRQPFGYFNRVFAHSAFLMNGLERPSALRFEDEGGYLPLHTVGLELAGEWVPGPVAIGYALTVGNGRGANPGDPQFTLDRSPMKSILGTVYLQHFKQGLKFGLNALYDEIPVRFDAVSGTVLSPYTREFIFGSWVQVDAHPFWVLMETYLVRHMSSSLGVRQTMLLFGEVRLDVWRIWLFSRGEFEDHPDLEDPYYGGGVRADTMRGFLGAGWKPVANLAVKFQGGMEMPLTTFGFRPLMRVQLAWAL